jgi:hypothetical protein
VATTLDHGMSEKTNVEGKPNVLHNEFQHG